MWVRHEATQKRLLTEPKLTLTKAIEIAEHKSRQINEMSQEVLKLTRKAAQRPPRPEQSQPQGFVTDVVAQIILQHTADTKRLSVTSVKRKGIPLISFCFITEIDSLMVTWILIDKIIKTLL